MKKKKKRNFNLSRRKKKRKKFRFIWSSRRFHFIHGTTKYKNDFFRFLFWVSRKRKYLEFCISKAKTTLAFSFFLSFLFGRSLFGAVGAKQSVVDTIGPNKHKMCVHLFNLLAFKIFYRNYLAFRDFHFIADNHTKFVLIFRVFFYLLIVSIHGLIIFYLFINCVCSICSRDYLTWTEFTLPLIHSLFRTSVVFLVVFCILRSDTWVLWSHF